MITSKLTARGQTTIPLPVRKAFAFAGSFTKRLPL